MRILRLIAFSVLFACLVSQGLEAGSLRIALLASAEVQSDTILLANLLPKTASRRMLAAAEKIALGETPQVGASRSFTRQDLTVAISSAGLSPSDFAIPVDVAVRRASRLISRQEVFAAIQSSLARNPIPGILSLRPQDITVEAAVRVPPGPAGLEVTQISFDPLLGRARVRLWPRFAPGVLPFFATVNAGTSFSAPQDAPKIVAVAAHTVGVNLNSTPVFVSMNRLARLHIHSRDLDMLLEVRPLQRGHLGEIIRVSLPGTGRTFQARVTGVGYLDATL